MTNRIRLLDLFRYYRQLPHQTAALTELEEAINKANPHILGRNQSWFKTWSVPGKQTDLSASITLIKEFEGLHLSSYADPLSGGEPWTIGYGSTRYIDGHKIGPKDRITAIEAESMLEFELDRVNTKLRETVPYWSEMSDLQRSALCSFAFNLGANFYDTPGFETITAKLKNREWVDVPAALMLYRNPGTRVEAGLARRRRAEGNLWIKGLPRTTAVQQEPAKLTPNSPFSARITPHIRIGEFALDQEARRFDAQHQVDTAAELAAFLERVRVQFGGKPVVITSGFRPPAVNKAVKGASGSEHLYSAPGVGAVDFYIKGANIQAVERWIDKEWPYSLGYGAKKGFHHVGIRRGRPRVRWEY